MTLFCKKNYCCEIQRNENRNFLREAVAHKKFFADDDDDDDELPTYEVGRWL
jgi:hypothetical protein